MTRDLQKSYACKECGQTGLHKRPDTLIECPVCGRLFAGEPKEIPPERVRGRKVAKK